ncbi:MAG TPA: polysaccharide biosynthesis tyrosine autokinase [Anaeromyxobacteraceae bacterium]|nr:polysaccharide biosynthesis tyrosine autokinase [Anaeromyxobacteraceae bacterium]
MDKLVSLPSSNEQVQRQQRPGPVRRPAAQPPRTRATGEPPAVAVPSLANHVWTLFEGRRTILLVTVAFLVLGLVYLFVADPVYRVTSLMQVGRRSQVVHEAEEPPAVPGESKPADASIEILKSRMLLGEVISALGLEIEARPRWFTPVGAAIARRHKGSLAPPLLGLKHFAWGGERIRVQRLVVPEELLGEPLMLTALGGGRLRLTDRGGAVLVEGPVGKPTLRGHNVELLVTDLVARPDTKFLITKRSRDEIVEALQSQLVVAEKSKLSGMVSIEAEGRDPVLITEMVNEMVRAYLRLDAERGSQDATERLKMIEAQLPVLRANLDKAEAGLNAFQVHKGTVDLSTETRDLFARQAQLEMDRLVLEQKRSELRHTYRDSYPNMVAISDQLAALKSEQANLAARMRSVPEAEVKTFRLTQDVKNARNLLDAMLGKAQELRIAKSTSLGDARIIDRAHRPMRPVRPKGAPVMALSLVLGLVAGAAAVFLRQALTQGAEDAEEVEYATGLPVYATIPYSEMQTRLLRGKNASKSPPPLLAAVAPGESAVEAIRSLRTSLFTHAGERNNIVALTGPAPRVGKSFVALNLAHAVAAAGGRVLLIDADLRRGCLHDYFRLGRSPGVADVVKGVTSLDDALRETGHEGLHVLSSGTIPSNPAELLASQQFEELLNDVSGRYDVVVVDTPPVLAVSDAMLVAHLAGTTYLVLRARHHSAREISFVVKQFGLNGVELHGAVLNGVRMTRGRYGRYGRYTKYELPPESRGETA